MVDAEVKRNLEALLRKELSQFCRRDGRLWKEPILATIRQLRETGARAVFFGGTPRTLLLSRLTSGASGRPRDIDIVVQGVSVEELRKQFLEIISRETRFGGLQLRRRGWQFDVWPLEQTWAFLQDATASPDFSKLPETTFFNLEAIAAEVWPEPGRERAIYSGDDQFFSGIADRVLEINRRDNPFPQLCVVRALLMGSSLDFSIGPQLAHYVAERGAKLAPSEMEDIQHHHYGIVRERGETLREWIDDIACATSVNRAPVRLPPVRQLTFWPIAADQPESRHVNIRCFHVAPNT